MPSHDYIKIEPAETASTVEGLVVPSEDGVFIAEVTARHQGNGNGTPDMSMKILINDRVDYQSKTIAWQDGPSSHSASTSEFLKAGEQYRFRAESANNNADAKGISMSIKRL